MEMPSDVDPMNIGEETDTDSDLDASSESDAPSNDGSQSDYSAPSSPKRARRYAPESEPDTFHSPPLVDDLDAPLVDDPWMMSDFDEDRLAQHLDEMMSLSESDVVIAPELKDSSEAVAVVASPVVASEAAQVPRVRNKGGRPFKDLREQDPVMQNNPVTRVVFAAAVSQCVVCPRSFVHFICMYVYVCARKLHYLSESAVSVCMCIYLVYPYLHG